MDFITAEKGSIEFKCVGASFNTKMFR
jgi:hypothetical protein